MPGGAASDRIRVRDTIVFVDGLEVCANQCNSVTRSVALSSIVIIEIESAMPSISIFSISRMSREVQQ